MGPTKVQLEGASRILVAIEVFEMANHRLAQIRAKKIVNEFINIDYCGTTRINFTHLRVHPNPQPHSRLRMVVRAP
jgi:hypothetical protein